MLVDVPGKLSDLSFGVHRVTLFFIPTIALNAASEIALARLGIGGQREANGFSCAEISCADEDVDFARVP